MQPITGINTKLMIMDNASGEFVEVCRSPRKHVPILPRIIHGSVKCSFFMKISRKTKSKQSRWVKVAMPLNLV